MSISRLARRVPSAKRIGVCTLHSHDLRFHKESKDGSGKCDAFHTGHSADCVIGSLFEMDPADKPSLDAAEGLGSGYDEKRVSLVRDSGEIVAAMTYYATTIDEDLKPYSWYLRHVIVGANESNCPATYVRRIEATETIEDKNQQRDAGERAIHG